MHRVKTIETIFGYASLYKSPCFIIQILKHASHYSTNYTIVHHQNKYAKKLHTSTIWEKFVISIIEEFYKLKYCSTVVYMVPRA